MIDTCPHCGAKLPATLVRQVMDRTNGDQACPTKPKNVLSVAAARMASRRLSASAERALIKFGVVS